MDEHLPGFPSPGLYIHYKGGRYYLLCVAETHEHNGDQDVVYISCTHGKACTRPLRQDSRKQDSWDDFIKWPDGKERPRFAPEFLFTDEELTHLSMLWAVAGYQ
jgi:hypothetical protein